MTLARREVIDATIAGEVPATLAHCLLSVLDTLSLPWFSGRLRVRYPVHTEREAEPPSIELEPEAARAVDAVILSTKKRTPTLRLLR
jgi:hypothetical protein